MEGERQSKTGKLAWSNPQRVLKRRVTYKQNTALRGQCCCGQSQISRELRVKKCDHALNNTGKNGKKWKTARFGIFFSSCRAGSRNSQRGMTIGNNSCEMGWQSCIQDRKEICNSIFCDLACATKQGKIHDRVGIKTVCKSKGWLTVSATSWSLCATETPCSNSRYWPSWSSCHLYHLRTTREDHPLFQPQDIFLCQQFQKPFLL